jgi:hypothetical protein
MTRLLQLKRSSGTTMHTAKTLSENPNWKN